jgi:hypothetical protein
MVAVSMHLRSALASKHWKQVARALGATVGPGALMLTLSERPRTWLLKVAHSRPKRAQSPVSRGSRQFFSRQHSIASPEPGGAHASETDLC